MIIEVMGAVMKMSHQTECVNKDTEIVLKKNQMEMLKLRSSITKISESHSVVSDSWPHSPSNSPGQETGVGSFSLLQEIFPTQVLNPGPPHGRQILYQLSYQGSPSEEELKNLLMKVKEESEKVGLKLIQKSKIMASGPITSWQIDGETMETVRDFTFWGSKITADGDCSHEVKRCLLLGRKVMTDLDSILKSRDITLLTKVCLVKAMVFPVVMCGCENWTVKKVECWRMDVLKCGVGEDSWESLGQQGDPTSPS